MPAVGSSWKSNRNYGAVIDAGSSGSRIQIYSWKDHRFVRELNDKPNGLPNIELADELGEKWQYKVEPGMKWVCHLAPFKLPTLLSLIDSSL